MHHTIVNQLMNSPKKKTEIIWGGNKLEWKINEVRFNLQEFKIIKNF